MHKPQPELAAIEVHGSTRVQFLTRATLAAGAVYGAGAVTPFVRGALAAGGDADVLNFALTLEYLEAGFYKAALQKANLSGDVKRLATELAGNEQAHVDALRTAIKGAGAMPVEAPQADFGQAFANTATFLKTANTFEDLGVSAYNGAAPSIRSAEVLAAAGSIVQVEARHAALIRLARDKPPAPQAFDKASEKADVLSAVKPFVATM